MSTQLVTLQNEITILKQQNEIMELRNKLQKTQAEKTSRLEDSLFSPALYEHYQKVAVTLSKSGVIPNAYRGKPEDIFVAMAMGYQLGFPVEQSLQDIAVINGRPCLWGDGLLSLALNHPQCESIDENPVRDSKGNVIGYQCIVIRKGHKPHSKTFTLQDANNAGLLKKGGVWNAYPERMLQMRARSLAIRDKFADALRGLRIAEIEDEDSRIIDAQPAPESCNETIVQTQTDKLNAILGDNEPSANQENTSKTTSSNHEQADLLASSSQIEEIIALMEEKGFTEDRKGNALSYYKVDALDKLSNAQAESFLNQLGRM